MNNDEIIANEMNNAEPEAKICEAVQEDAEISSQPADGQLTDPEDGSGEVAGVADEVDDQQEDQTKEYEKNPSWPYCNSILERLFRSIREALEIEELDIEVDNIEELEIDALEIDGLDDFDDEEAVPAAATRLHTDEDFAPIVRIFERQAEKQKDGARGAGSGISYLNRLLNHLRGEDSGGEHSRDDFDASPRKMAPTVISLAVCLLLMFVVIYYILFAHDLRAMTSVKQLEVAADAYCMSYTGDYHFDEFLEQGGAMEEKMLSMFIGEQACGGMFGDPTILRERPESIGSAFSAENSITLRGTLMGRTFNSTEEMMILTVVTRPDNGYDSVSTVDLSALGYTAYSRPGAFSRYDMLAAPYLPLDGMNECGLCAVVLTLPDVQAAYYNSSLPDLTATTAVRLVLDKADSVEEALDLLSRYDVHPALGWACQIALSDHDGNSVVVKWDEGEMQVTEQLPYASNCSIGVVETLTTKFIEASERFQKLCDTYDQYDGAMTEVQVFNTIEAVSSEGDGWRVVFDTCRKVAIYSFGSDRDTRFTVSLD